MNIKFVSSVLLMGTWGALVVWHGANQDLFINAIYAILVGLGVIHAKGTS